MSQPTFEDFDKDLTELRNKISDLINEVSKKYPSVQLTVDVDHRFAMGDHPIAHIVNVEGEIRR